MSLPYKKDIKGGGFECKESSVHAGLHRLGFSIFRSVQKRWQFSSLRCAYHSTGNLLACLAYNVNSLHHLPRFHKCHSLNITTLQRDPVCTGEDDYRKCPTTFNGDITIRLFWGGSLFHQISLNNSTVGLYRNG